MKLTPLIFQPSGPACANATCTLHWSRIARLAGQNTRTASQFTAQHGSYAGESDFPFAQGDAIRTDYVAHVQGYPGHQPRCAVLGTPGADQRRQYALIRDIYRRANDLLAPGRTAGKVSLLAGHSVGAWWHQQEPVISGDISRRLEEGMVIGMEPHVDHWHIQDMFVVRADGPELISDKFPTETILACN